MRRNFARTLRFLAFSLVPVACGGGSSTDDTAGPDAGGAAGAPTGGSAGTSGGTAGKGGGVAGGSSGGGGSAGSAGSAGKGGAGPGGATTGGTGGAGAVSGASGQGGSGGGCNCPSNQVCSHGACVPKTMCASDDQCQNDTYCDPAQGCLPWEGKMPPSDPGCIHVAVPGVLAPKVKCEFSKAPAGDAFPNHVDVQGTPIVATFAKGKDLPPSIAASFTATVIANYTEDLGVIRVLDGRTCTVQANLGGKDLDGDGAPDFTVSSASLAAADLDGDGAAEIIAYGSDGAMLAFTLKQGTWSLLWKSAKNPAFACDTGNHRCPGGWAGPSVHDLDDDGLPEILREGHVYSSTGKVLSAAPGGYQGFSQGLFSVTANLDGDPAIETTDGASVWEWKGGAWVKDPTFLPGDGPGHVSIANFGNYGAGLPAARPELAVVRNGVLTIHAMTGQAIFGPITIPGMGSGGPPTIADFDGDGLPEVSVASKGNFTVFDIDCGPNPRPGGKCIAKACDFGACPPGVAWSRTTQDISSSVTGSSVFDFEADGVSEVVYGDECFTRVYNGQTGEVVFSQYRSSCTWYENPIIADTDGDFRADLVSPSNKACSPDGTGIVCSTLNADGVDPQFNGLHCKTGKDCVSGACDAGLCRCTTTSQCCKQGTDPLCVEEGYKCAKPNANTPGMGNTCRAAHPHGVSGIRVYSDANDQWVRSRAIWNQHAYAVTHVNDDGTIPKTSQWKNNWDDPTLNNFRQNVPGTSNVQGVPDLTAGAATTFLCSGGKATMTVAVCNRGAETVGPGVKVSFSSGGMKLCDLATKGSLAPNVCEDVTCVWDTPPKSAGAKSDVIVIANSGSAVTECKTGNNQGTVYGVFCL